MRLLTALYTKYLTRKRKRAALVRREVRLTDSKCVEGLQIREYLRIIMCALIRYIISVQLDGGYYISFSNISSTAVVKVGEVSIISAFI